MNEQEILNEIEKTKEHLANMEKMLEECEYERWKPQEGAIFFFVDWDCDIEENIFNSANPNHRARYNAYNCFKTEEEAKAEAEKILVRRMLEDIARRLNKGEKIDWGNDNQSKYYIYTTDEGVDIGANYISKLQGTVYCLDKNFLKVAIQEIGEERLERYLKGE